MAVRDCPNINQPVGCNEQGCKNEKPYTFFVLCKEMQVRRQLLAARKDQDEYYENEGPGNAVGENFTCFYVR